MRNELPHIESSKAGLLFVLAGCVMDAAIGVCLFFVTQVWEPIFGFGFFGGFLMAALWMSILVGRYNRRHRILYSRELRHAHGLRSPWGEKRTEVSGPYADRLAHFLANSIEPDSTQNLAERAPSTTPFWSYFDLPQDTTEPKPTWYLRRMLLRIKEAVRGSQH